MSHPGLCYYITVAKASILEHKHDKIQDKGSGVEMFYSVTSSYWLFFAFALKHSSTGSTSDRNTGQCVKRCFTRTIE